MHLFCTIYFLFLFLFHEIHGFSLKTGAIRCVVSLHAHNAQGQTNQTATFFPLLPPSDTIDSPSSVDRNSITLGGDSQPVAFVAQAKFELQYTCNICETRNSHKVSRLGMYLLFFVNGIHGRFMVLNIGYVSISQRCCDRCL
jgi:hypothetical protein